MPLMHQQLHAIAKALSLIAPCAFADSRTSSGTGTGASGLSGTPTSLRLVVLHCCQVPPCMIEQAAEPISVAVIHTRFLDHAGNNGTGTGTGSGVGTGATGQLGPDTSLHAFAFSALATQPIQCINAHRLLLSVVMQQNTLHQ